MSFAKDVHSDPNLIGKTNGEFGALSFADKGRAIGAAWKSADEATKSTYESDYSAEKVKYVARRDAYVLKFGLKDVVAQVEKSGKPISVVKKTKKVVVAKKVVKKVVKKAAVVKKAKKTVVDKKAAPKKKKLAIKSPVKK